MADNSGITVTFDSDNIALIKMDNGQNRINLDFVKAFDKALDNVINNPDAIGLVTTGEGKFYSNGLDLPWLGSQSPEGFSGFWLAFNRLLVRISTFPMPTVASINGHAFAGGALIALSHDHRVMTSDKGWLCMNEVFMQARFSEFILELLKSKLPPGRARTDIVTLAKRVTGAQLVEIGVALSIAPASLLLQQARAVILGLVGQQGPYPRDGMGDMKRDLYHTLLVAMKVPYKMLELPAHI